MKKVKQEVLWNNKMSIQYSMFPKQERFCREMSFLTRKGVSVVLVNIQNKLAESVGDTWWIRK